MFFVLQKNAGSKDADTSSSTGLKATVDEVTDFVTTALPVLLEITRKGGRFEPDSIAFLRNSFQVITNYNVMSFPHLFRRWTFHVNATCI